MNNDIEGRFLAWLDQAAKDSPACATYQKQVRQGGANIEQVFFDLTKALYEENQRLYRMTTESAAKVTPTANKQT